MANRSAVLKHIQCIWLKLSDIRNEAIFCCEACICLQTYVHCLTVLHDSRINNTKKITKVHLTRKKTILWILAIICNYSAHAQPDSIDVFIKNEMQQKKIPGLQLAIARNNKIVKLGNYGLANVQDSIPVNENTVFSINSISKAFTGVAIMQLVEEGKINLDSSIAGYLDSIPVSWKNITVKQLLGHTSGIPNIMADAKLILPEDDEASWRKVQILPLDFKAGDEFRYNQTNYLLLGKIIDKYSAVPFSEFIIKNQLQKAGMIYTRFGDAHDIIPNSSRGYTHFRNGKLTNIFEEFPSFLRTAAGMNSTAKELANWVIALQNDQLLTHPGSVSILWTPIKLNNGQTGGFSEFLNGYALGWPIVARSEHPAIAAVGGGRSALFIYPKDNMSIIILTNLQGASPESFIDEVAGFYVPEMKEANGFGFSASVKLLKTSLDKIGYKYAVEQAKKFKVSNASFQLTENEINSWGYKLMSQDRKPDAIEIFKLNVNLYPNSTNTYDSLGESYAAIGETALAIKNYETAFKLDPKNINASEQVRKLKSLR